MNHKKTITNTLRVISLSFVFSAMVSYSFAAWVSPTVAPPGGNPEPPINTSATAQVKTGNLGVNNLITTGAVTSPAFCIGTSCIFAWPLGGSGSGGGGGSLSGGIANTLPVWTSAGTLGNSSITTNASGDISSSGSITSPEYCIGTSCITVWPTSGGGGGSSGGLSGGITTRLPVWTSATTLGNSGVTASVGGDIRAAGFIKANGNLFTDANVVAAGTVSAGKFSSSDGNIYTDASFIAAGNVKAAGFIQANGNLSTAANVVAAGTVSAGKFSSSDGNIYTDASFIAAGNVKAAGFIKATNNLFTDANVVATGNIIGGQVTSPKYCIGTSCITAWPTSGGSASSDSTILNTSATGQVKTGNLGVNNFTAANTITAGGNIVANGNLRSTVAIFSGILSAGDIAANNSGQIVMKTSDARLKKNIETISDSMDVIAALKKLRGVYYNWNTDIPAAKDMGDKRNIGLIAQEVEKVFPEVVGMNSDGYKTLSISNLVGFLVEVNKTQQAEIETQQSRIENLERDVEFLKSKIQ